MSELSLEFRPEVAAPIAPELSPKALRASLEALGVKTLALHGVNHLGMPAQVVHLWVEPDAEFLVVFAKELELAALNASSHAVTVFLDDGILELSAACAGEGAWSRMGYQDNTNTVEMPTIRLLLYWRTLVADLVRHATLQTSTSLP